MRQMSTNAPYILEWYDPVKNEACKLPLKDMSIALAYKDRKEEAGMLNVRVYSEWNKGYIITQKVKVRVGI
jgi:hypothetical protein